MNKRPLLSSSISGQHFASWYWLKEELVAFCREHQIPTSGSKLQLQSRITDYLNGKKRIERNASTRRTGRMPTHLTMDTVIEDGWRCGPALGAFFKKTLGPGFHFNASMRDFIHTQTGKTLSDAAICYQTSVRPGTKKTPIPRHLEYNQHFRDYFRENQGPRVRTLSTPGGSNAAGRKTQSRFLQAVNKLCHRFIQKAAAASTSENLL
ncbi:DUF6434 domain-containing protein [Granulicella sp. S190]|uniref:DUF6434 domain-containing protein n=1 Tax=Granulicella sp. S190 TaxID=1747226 RepID=UPI00131AF5B6|nr:DUF6434 domain-containing protein [Granulicella sp. S190]